MKRVHIYVSGRVQGVGFRAFVQHTAQTMNLTGWVKNLYDGRVEVLTEGSEDDINAFIDKLKEGPIGARVDNADVNWEKYQGGQDNFRIAW
jgi:acylphosphatase